MLEKIIKTAQKAEKELIFEIGSNSDLILENTITHNLKWTIENFVPTQKGLLTFPTKFDMVEEILPLNHQGRVIIRMSVNPKEIIAGIEFGTSRLENRIEAINKLAQADYKIGILIAPIVLVDKWQQYYEELIKILSEKLSHKAKKEVFFELIFMTYSYIHRMINKDAFPAAIDLFNPNLMTGRGKGKYTYKADARKSAERFLREKMKQYFPNNEIKYIV